MIEVVGFDGDDTLWHNESLFSVSQSQFRQLMRGYVSDDVLDARLLASETANLAVFGYGVKGFTLSMIETAIEVSGGRVTADHIQRIIGLGRGMLEHPVELLDGVDAAVDAVGDRYRLLLITKGDLFDQESKLARSGLAERFWKIEVVSEKDETTYRRVLGRYDVDPSRFLMVGNSVRSDVLPVLGIGGRAVHIPYHLTWAHEHVDDAVLPPGQAWALDSIGGLPELLAQLDAAADE